MKLLCISNGHGEDVIALRILNALRQYAPELHISALPISGTGSAYQSQNIPIVGPAKTLPSGGFLNRDPKQLARDVQKGLLPLTRQQLQAIKKWAAETTPKDSILAVGDIVPLLFARLSKLSYHFIGTAKSEYWIRDERGKLPSSTFSDRLEGWSGSVYLPWERWLMSSDRCKSIFVRDALTAQHLQTLGIPADYAGNPMMDNLAPTGKLTERLNTLSSTLRPAQPPSSNTLPPDIDPAPNKATALYVTPKQQPTHPLTIVLLPGSRQPEAYENWERILTTLPSLKKSFPTRPLILLGAIAPSLSPQKLQTALPNTWATQSTAPYPTFTHQNITLLLINNAYSDCLHQADIAIATAGTATEQFVGLGKPAITLPGNGPQFTPTFAKVQARMLGPAIQILTAPTETGPAIHKLINTPDRLQLIYQNGTHRMGSPDAGKRIAKKLLETMNDER
ncbi:MAG: lipid-A-disaccharide synthase-related protein [Phormidesmis sp.]